jgi:hypothetical protein
MNAILFIAMLGLAEFVAQTGYTQRADTTELERDPRWKGWTRWPSRESGIGVSIYIPPGFQASRLYFLVADEKVPFFDVRLRSPDGRAEFALKVAGVSDWAISAIARSLPWDRISSSEVVTEDHLNKVEGDVAGETAYEEEITAINTNPPYTRYFKRSFSMSKEWYARSLLWEFEVADDLTRSKYQALYRQFKESLLQIWAE